MAWRRKAQTHFVLESALGKVLVFPVGGIFVLISGYFFCCSVYKSTEHKLYVSIGRRLFPLYLEST